MDITVNKVLDCKGLSCPMPIVRTKKAMGEIEPGEVLEVQATDKGSTVDIQAWAKNTGHEYLGTETEGELLRHFLRKGGGTPATETSNIPEIGLEDFQEKVERGDKLRILDVRELKEYEERHIPDAIHIPLGEVEDRYHELNKEDELHVICHSGRRSGLAAQALSKKGFKKLVNVVPGMSHWTGKTE